MRKIRETLRLKSNGYSNRKIARSICGSASTVFDYLARAKAAALTWPLPEALDDEALEQLLFPEERQRKRYQTPDWAAIHTALKRKGVTKELLWQEYRANDPKGMSYSNFCQQYLAFEKTLCTSMRQNHRLGEKLFVDYAGATLAWIDSATAEWHEVQLFVAVLGASHYTYVEATASQGSADWLMSHVRAFEYFGGVPDCIVPDNLKSAVSQAHRYDPQINPSYQELAHHYGVAIIPTRVRKPQDKAKVEVGVQGIERWILAPLRNHTFHSLTEINEAISPLLEAYNAKAFKLLPGSRVEQFKQHEQACLHPLPKERYVYASWHQAKVAPDYHVAYQKHYYSVPYQYIGKLVQLRIAQYMIECFYKGRCIATHQRSHQGGHTTNKSHMPTSHQRYADWTPERLLKWARRAGEHTEQFIEKLIETREVPQQAFRACFGTMQLMKAYGREKLDRACQRALELNVIRYQSVASILKNGLEEKQGGLVSAAEQSLPKHHNIRGKDYYQ